MTAYASVSVPHKGPNAGRPKPKKDHLVIFRWADVETDTTDEKGVNITAFAFKAGKKPIGVYQTQSGASIYESSNGEPGLSQGQVHHCDLEHPGTGLEISEFRENNSNVALGAIQVYCDPAVKCKLAGSRGNPLYLTTETKDGKDGDISSIKLAQAFQGGVIRLMDKALVPDIDDPTLFGDVATTGL